MLHKVERRDYSKVTPIFNDLTNQIVIGSVIEGNTVGEIYADDSESPTFAVVWDKMDAILIEGELNSENINSLKHLISGFFKPDAIQRNVPVFNIYYPNYEAWDNMIGDILAELSPVKETKLYFEFDKIRKSIENPISDYWSCQQIDENLLRQTDVKNLDKVIGWITSFWPSNREFTNKGIGYCLFRDDIIVSWCLSVFVSGSKYELGLETIVEYRGRGYAKLVADACVKYCLEKNFIPLWNCDAGNKASKRVAEAIGFKRMKDYDVLHLDL